MRIVGSARKRRSHVVLSTLRLRAAAAAEATGLLRGLFGDSAARAAAIEAIDGIAARDTENSPEELKSFQRACDGAAGRGQIVRLVWTLAETLALCRRCSERVRLYGLSGDPGSARQVAESLAETAQTLRDAIGSFGSASPQSVLSDCAQARARLDEAERAIERTLGSVFSGKLSEGDVVEWKDVCDILEAAEARCKEASELIAALALV